MLFTFTPTPCAAQSDQRLPDSLSTEVDNVPVETKNSAPKTPSVEAPVSDSSRVDTSNSITDPNLQTSFITAEDSASLRRVPHDVVKAYKRDKDFEYANDPAYWVRERPGGFKENAFSAFLRKLFANEIFKLLLYVLLAAVLGFALYKIIAVNNLHLFYRSPQKVRDGTEPGDEMDMDETDLEKKIRDALAAHDHRLATRYHFLKALRLLKDRNLIAWHAQATNQDYTGQMSEHPQGKNFRLLADAYEHVWYGNFTLTEEQSGWLVKYFQDFYKAIGTR
ncbi:MAG TPA: DUF4129 domain-containing protein [Puia sp.]|nr:DUF4129 domain-containing protein [Puia sp.]